MIINIILNIKCILVARSVFEILYCVLNKTKQGIIES